MIAIDCVRSAPPRNNAFHAACRKAASSTSAMTEGVSKPTSSSPRTRGPITTGLSSKDETLAAMPSQKRDARGYGSRRSPGVRRDDNGDVLPLERGLEAVELRHQRIADGGALGRCRVDRGVEAADFCLQR